MSRCMHVGGCVLLTQSAQLVCPCLLYIHTMLCFAKLAALFALHHPPLKCQVHKMTRL